MIVINNKILLKNQTEINEFSIELRGEVYDKASDFLVESIIDFLGDIWERDERLTYMVQKKVSQDIFPIIHINISEAADLTKVEFEAFSEKNNLELTSAQKHDFDNLCSSYFKSLKSLYDRICEFEE